MTRRARATSIRLAATVIVGAGTVIGSLYFWQPDLPLVASDIRIAPAAATG